MIVEKFITLNGALTNTRGHLWVFHASELIVSIYIVTIIHF